MIAHVLLSADAAGGVWTYTLDLARGLSARGVAVTLAVLGPACSAAQHAQAAGAAHIIETGLPLDWTAEDADALASAATGLRQLATARQVDLVQLHSPALIGEASWPMPVLAVLHSCAGTWWDAVRGGNPPADFAWRMAAVAQGLEAADALIAPSAAIAEAAQRVYGLRRTFTVVHNGCTAVVEGRDGTREDILAAGRIWDEAKNFALLEQAARLAPDLPLAAAGPCTSPHGQHLALSAMRWLGCLTASEMRRAMLRARIFAAPARYEPFGLAVLEAALAGAALVLADIPTFRELWQGAAVFLPPDDPAIWVETLRRLHAQPEVCERAGAAARLRAGRYGTQRFITGMLKHYHRLAVQPGRRVFA